MCVFHRYQAAKKEFEQLTPELSFDIIAELVASGLLIANQFEKQDMKLLQELYLRRLYHCLLEKICDPLEAPICRKQSLEFAYKPLLALKRIYHQWGCREKYLALEHEFRTLSHEFNPYN